MKLTILFAGLAACGTPVAHPGGTGVSIDRFSSDAGHLLIRDAHNGLPGPDQPIDFDGPPFLTQGLGPNGAPVRYYNFDVQSDSPSTLFRIVRNGEPVAGQADLVDKIPGDSGYNDFWRIALVEAPDGFVPGAFTSAEQVHDLAIKPDPRIIDCPIVPRGSTAREGHGVPPAVPTELWYRGTKVMCLQFGEPLAVEADGRVPTSPIYVAFAKNPGTPSGGPASGFRTEPSAPQQTHNVVMSVPGDTDYSPLWAVHIYDRAAFDQVHDATTALAAPLVKDGPLVNCPIVYVTPR
ncbi:MAG: hypothetical protein JWO36_3915 [Myxococcales bacterium]|nr:hypothetical protein [Myxococcales bacterium]